MLYGTIQVFTRTGGNAPVSNVEVRITTTYGTEVARYYTNDEGYSDPVKVETPPASYSLDENNDIKPYSSYNVYTMLDGYLPITMNGVQSFEDQNSLIELSLIPVNASTPDPVGEMDYNIPEHHLFDNTKDTYSLSPLEICSEWVLNEVVIPEKVTVHLGKPSANARNVTVPFIDYIKNVASSEIYPTWPKESLKANILAQISLLLNRVYTEWYRSRGYTYTITNSTSYDQYYVHGRNIFDSISVVVDDIFNTYIRKIGTVNPFYSEYCDGKTVTCNGMKQWGTVTYAQQGLSALQILRKYYSNIELIESDNIKKIPESYPGTPLSVGSTGVDVRTMQRQLNRIAKDYPFLGTQEVDGIFGQNTKTIVQKFQKQFSLTQDGIVGKSTWYKISYIYVSVKDLAELTSEGEKPNGDNQPNVEGSWPGVYYRVGSRGDNVKRIQFYLNTVGDFDSSIEEISVDGIFGAGTERAVKEFQEASNLTPDGVVGQGTWDALYKQYSSIEDDTNTDQDYPGEYPGQSFSVGSRGNYVKTIQFWLGIISSNYTSIPDLTADGIFGAGTERSVIAFQEFFRLTADGIVGKATWQKINEVYIDVLAEFLPENSRPGTPPASSLSLGSSGPKVKEMQFYLQIMSAYYQQINYIEYDGVFGRDTEIAVKAFQEMFSLVADGIVGTLTWEKMYSVFLRLRNVDGPVYRTLQVPYDQPLSIGSDGVTVEWVQYMLLYISKFYDTIEIVEVTGSYDYITELAVKDFQSIFSIPVTGVVDQNTFDQMVLVYYSLLSQVEYTDGTTIPIDEYSGFALTIDSSGPAVWEVQFMMNEIASRYCTAFYVTEDGFYGDETFLAVQQFQYGLNIPITGVVDKETWEKIYYYYTLP